MVSPAPCCGFMVACGASVGGEVGRPLTAAALTSTKTENLVLKGNLSGLCVKKEEKTGRWAVRTPPTNSFGSAYFGVPRERAAINKQDPESERNV